MKIIIAIIVIIVLLMLNSYYNRKGREKREKAFFDKYDYIKDKSRDDWTDYVD